MRNDHLRWYLDRVFPAYPITSKNMRITIERLGEKHKMLLDYFGLEEKTIATEKIPRLVKKKKLCKK